MTVKSQEEVPHDTAPESTLGESVTVVVRRQPRPGRAAAYDAWLTGVIGVAQRFPGHLGATVIRDEGEHVTLVFRFARLVDLDAWEASPESAEWLARADALCKPPNIARMSGMETWFRLPGGGTVAPPPRWKMAAVSFAVAFPLIQILSATVGRVLGFLPSLARGAVVGLSMVLVMTYWAMPIAVRMLRRWLYP